MLKKSMLFALVSVIVASAIAAHAETIAEKAEWAQIDETNKGYLETLSTACGGKIKLEIDKASFKEKSEVSNFVWAATEGIANVCNKSKDAKKTVAEKIKTIKMSYGKEKYAFTAGVFAYTTDLGATTWNSSGSRDKITEWVEKNL